MNKSLIIICLLFLGNASWAIAQDNKGSERGEVTNAEFVIRKDRVLSLPTRPRNFESAPNIPQPEGLGNFNYDVRDFFFTLDPSISELKPYQKRFPSTTQALNHGLVKLGYGNYQSPLAELHINNVESDYLNFGVFLKHQGFYEGPVDKENSAEDHTNVRLSASYFTEFFEVFGKLGYDRDRYHFYGYTPGTEVTADEIQQLFHSIYGQAGIRNIEKDDPLNYELKLGARLFNDDYDAREHEINFSGKTYYNFNDETKAGVNLEALLTSPSDITYSDINRNYVKFSPYVKYQNESFEVKAGANLVVENDVYADKGNDFHVFPSIEASYNLQEEFALYASYIGDVKRNTYYSFAMENPYLGPSDQLLNTIQKFKAEGGIRGSVEDAFTYKLGVAYGDYENMHFYGNSMNDSTRFQIVYDDTQVLNYTGSLVYSFGSQYQINASANYYHYIFDDEQNVDIERGAWQKPKWEINVHNTFTPDEKWLLQAGLDMMGGIDVINFMGADADNTATLSPIIDLNAKVDYKITDRFSVFAQGNNLLNQKNERYWNYQSRGIQGIGGLTFKF
ncbi:TonB-dependent receptor domain-containing protein [Echinicola shivajiensis]|uniref:TonB-dependent receptor domain-containing protein n=1 Tax=Echinicola shivajiensis TaxID=1035916 RepID=UPI001BFCC7EA|nr:TonB-dependent receptor [Echinicola shivajiensis]